MLYATTFIMHCVFCDLFQWSDLMKELDYIVLLYAVATAHIDMHTFKVNTSFQ